MSFIMIFRKVVPLFFVFLIIFLSVTPLQGEDLRCHICGKGIEGRYWLLDGKVYCDDCYQKVGPRCFLCNSLLTEEYCIVPYTGNTFCKDCYNKYPLCRTCGNPVGPDGTYIDSERCLCPLCYSKAIFTHASLGPVYQEAVLELRLLGLEITKPVSNLSIMSQDELDSYLGMDGVGENGFCESWTSAGQVYAHRIYVLYGLSYEEALAVLCHELSHAWHAENNPYLKSGFFCEGFAEWVSYKVMVKKGFLNYAEKMYKNPDPVYGDGLRYILDIEKKYGTASTIDYLKKLRD